MRPLAALASRLRSEGHDPVLAAPALYHGLASAGEVAFVPLDLDMTEVGRAVAGRHGLRHLLAFAKAMGQRAARVLPGDRRRDRPRPGGPGHPSPGTADRPASGRDARRSGGRGRPLARAGADAGVPVPGLAVHAQPARAAEPPVVPAARYLTGAWCRRDIDDWRRSTLGLHRRPGRHDPLGDPSVTVLHSFSSHVVPRPADWPATAHVTGYWFTGTSRPGRRPGGSPASSAPGILLSTLASEACPLMPR